MPAPEHDLHRRRKGRNVTLGLVLGGFVLLIFAVTLVKLSNGGQIKGFDHNRGSLVVAE